MNNSELRELYSPDHDRCACCWIQDRDLRHNRINPELELAHIIPRSRGLKRGQCVENVLMLCSSCHEAVHGQYGTKEKRWPELCEDDLLLIKHEIGELNISVISKIAGWTENHVKDLTYNALPLPLEIIHERQHWRPMHFRLFVPKMITE